jgi:uncharacterized membrane protein YphA (DoxX/SURF4 family)
LEEIFMSNPSLAKDTFAPLVLRLALAAVFIYHGWHKIKEHDWGAAWATNLWVEQQKPPASVLARLRELPGESKEKLADIEQKLKNVYNKERPEMPQAIRFTTSQFAVAWGELVGGIALLLGFLTRWAALGLVIIQVGAIFTVTGAKGFYFAGGGGYEYNLALVAMCVAVLLLGGGTLAVDQLFSRRPRTPQRMHAAGAA